MPTINQNELPWTEQKSPGGRFCVHRKQISLALGGLKDVGTWGGGHPFDVELTRIPPGASNWPLHSHAAQWELFLLVSGTGEFRSAAGVRPVAPGDCVLCPPGEAHQLTNTGEEDLVFYVIADHPPADVIHYPDSEKWCIKPQRRIFTMQEIDYYAGEEG